MNNYSFFSGLLYNIRCKMKSKDDGSQNILLIKTKLEVVV